MRSARSIVSPFPIGPEPRARRYTAGTVEHGDRLFFVEPAPQARVPVRSSIEAGDYGPRGKIAYIKPVVEAGRRAREANTRIGLSFFVPKGARARQDLAAVQPRQRVRQRYQRVLRTRRPDKTPGTYGEA